ncbi:hypothetical protein INR76_00230 [Marixanthomonas sp. SCSIO 43207]|uniref:hypothetical protein n=1 Tax=Marixanthomonas sp. SCSIO 43207 TaxID=2779360 RepID=UPI001CA7B8AA|nr:hypothetical protein [Marixanthomonas sp. SCSIO 43207]UAB81218.1 hypothetical protein INR76_00230 [Marixanthomonas sp. SCSIO 43207]
MRQYKKIRILYTIPNFNTAGSGKIVYDLLKGLDPSKFEVAIACAHTKGALFKEVESLGVPIHILQFTISYYLYTFYRCFLKLYWLLKGEYQNKLKSYPFFFERKSKMRLDWYYEETYALGEKYKKTFQT